MIYLIAMLAASFFVSPVVLLDHRFCVYACGDDLGDWRRYLGGLLL